MEVIKPHNQILLSHALNTYAGAIPSNENFWTEYGHEGLVIKTYIIFNGNDEKDTFILQHEWRLICALNDARIRVTMAAFSVDWMLRWDEMTWKSWFSIEQYWLLVLIVNRRFCKNCLYMKDSIDVILEIWNNSIEFSVILIAISMQNIPISTKIA